jgi:type IV pilus assembly protein PilA
MPRTLTTTLACAALLALPGCGGGSSSDKPSAPKADPAQQAQQDAQAKSDARNLATQIESCYVDNESYEPCGLGADGTVAGQDTGLGDAARSGSLTTETSTQGYVVTAKSESGNSFVLTKGDGGALERTCTTKGEGGCPASGAW